MTLGTSYTAGHRHNTLNSIGSHLSSDITVRVLGVLIAGYLALSWNGVFPLDDAYITLHNARSLISGADPVYGVSPLVGATSLVHLALLSALGLVLPFPTASILICAAFAVLYVLALTAALRKAGAKGWVVPVATGSGMLIGTIPIQLMNGLETGMAMAAVAMMLALHDNRRWLPLLAGTAPFIRPELALLAAPLLVRLCWRGSPRDVFRIGAAATIAALPWITWSLIETGQPIPGTITAKIAFFNNEGSAIHSRFQWLMNPLGSATGLVMLVLASMGLAGVASGPLRWPIAIFVGGLVGVAWMLVPGSLAWNDYRYLAPLLPALLVVFAEFPNERLGKILIAAVGICTIMTGWIGVDRLQTKRAYAKGELAALRSTIAPLPPGSRVLIHDAGMIAWVAPHLRLIDAVGLKTPQSVGWHRSFTTRSCQFGQALDGIARSQDASHALVLQRPFWRCVGDNLVQTGWKLNPLPSPGAYQLFQLSPPNDRTRKDRHP